MSKTKVLGLIARDSTGWQEDFEEAVKNSGYGIMWKDQLSDMNYILEPLRTQIESQGYFEYYNISNNRTNYKGKVVDFAIKTDYESKVNDWKLKNPEWFSEKFEEYADGNNKAVIVFLVKDFVEIPNTEQFHIDLFRTFNGKKASQKNAVAFTYILTKNQIKHNNMIDEIKDILKVKKNIILQGAPGTGKTYTTAELALKICGIDTNTLTRDELMEEYNRLSKAGQIAFVTFHQTMDYDDFIEGLKPQVEDGEVTYDIEDGIFKKICTDASIKDESNFDESFDKLLSDIQETEYFPVESSGGAKFHVAINSKQNLTLYTGSEKKMNGVLTREKIRLEYFGQGSKYWVGYNKGVVNLLYSKYGLRQPSRSEKKNYVLIIDEINRGNVSKIFGELITLLEADKRSGETNCIPAKLSYSKEDFTVPSNLYIIGTMNTTDRSVGSIDYAIRRRFAFFTLESSWKIAEETYTEEDKKAEAKALYYAVEKYLKEASVDMDIEDLMVGHSYFMSKDEPISRRWEYEILPLLNEYYKDGICGKSPLDGIPKSDKDLYLQKFIEKYKTE